MKENKVELGGFLAKVREEIREKEEAISKKRRDILNTDWEPPNKAEARDLYFRTTEVEVETDVVQKIEAGGKIKFYVFETGAGYEKTNTTRIKIKMISQGHIFPSNFLSEVESEE